MRYAMHMLLAALLAAAGAVPAGAQTIEIEAEAYDACLDLGGTAIGTALDPDCSGNYLLEGLDVAGEWTEYHVAALEPGIYQPRLVCRGNSAEAYRLVLVVTGDVSGAADTTEFLFTGVGYG
ncbi:MAG: hypothetical protein JW876_02425 [Candidatus Krumholzibacteriota bacterium]|nr:hypothetical protein [Candidatus Krumholzibacteriota bacterium]